MMTATSTITAPDVRKEPHVPLDMNLVQLHKKQFVRIGSKESATSHIVYSDIWI